MWPCAAGDEPLRDDAAGRVDGEARRLRRTREALTTACRRPRAVGAVRGRARAQGWLDACVRGGRDAAVARRRARRRDARGVPWHRKAVRRALSPAALRT